MYRQIFNHQKRVLLILLLCNFCFTLFLAQSQTLVAWDFENTTTPSAPSTFPTYGTASNVTVGSSQLTTFSAGYNSLKAISTTGFPSTSTPDLGKYFEFSISPNSDFGINISEISFFVQRSNTGPTAWVLRSSINNYTTNLAASTTAIPTLFATTANTSGLLSGNASLQNVTSTITFRLYGVAASATGGTMRIDNLTIAGTIQPASNSPLIYVSATSLSAFSTTIGIASATQFYNVSGFNLVSNINISAPTGFEISLSANSGFAPSLLLTPVSGSIALTKIYVRLTSLTTGYFSGNMMHTSSSATAKNLSVSGRVTTLACISDNTPPVFKNSNFIFSYNGDLVVGNQILQLTNADSVQLTSALYPSVSDNCDANPIIRLVSGDQVNQQFGGNIGNGSILKFEAIDFSANRSECFVRFSFIKKQCIGNTTCITFPSSGNASDYIVVSSSGAAIAQESLLTQKDTVNADSVCFHYQPSFILKIYMPDSAYVDGHSGDFTLANLILLDPIEVPSCGTIPVELVRFYAENKNKENHLYWATASEFQSHKFEIERSSDGKNFFKVGEIPSEGKAANYEFIDAHPLNISYYRLRQIDFNGKGTLSNVISIVRVVADEITLFPNPTNGKVYIKSSESDSKSVRIVNNLGQVVIAKAIMGNEIDMSDLPKGMYYIEISSETQRFQKRIFKN